MSPKELRWRVASGRWRKPCHGIVVAHSGPMTEEQRLWAAVLWAGQGAVLRQRQVRVGLCRPAVATQRQGRQRCGHRDGAAGAFRRLLYRASMVVWDVSGSSRPSSGGMRQLAGLRLASRETRDMCG
jgi:hypothetical protein